MKGGNKSVTTPRNAKDYLSKNEIPQLFESLMTGLMYHRPPEPLDYLQDCINKIKQQGAGGVRWDMFLANKKPPVLPPIEPRESRESRGGSPQEESVRKIASPTEKRATPLPAIQSKPKTPPPAASAPETKLELGGDVIFVFLFGGPGLDRSEHTNELVKHFSGTHCICVTQLLRQGMMRLESGVIGDDPEWTQAKSNIENGDFVDNELINKLLIEEIKNHPDTTCFILDGYPRNKQQIQSFDSLIGKDRSKFSLLIDTLEDKSREAMLNRERRLSESVINRRLDNYTKETLPLINFVDSNGNLRIIDGEQKSTEVYRQIFNHMASELGKLGYEVPAPIEAPPDSADDKPKSAITREPTELQAEQIRHLTNVFEESTSRLNDLPDFPIILIIGGPASGRTILNQLLPDKYSGWAAIQVDDLLETELTESNESTLADIPDQHQDDKLVKEYWSFKVNSLVDRVKSFGDKQGIFLMGFPKTELDLNEMNQAIGRIDLVLLIDCDESTVRQRAQQRGAQADDDATLNLRLQHFKEHTLSIARYYDEQNRLIIIPGDRESDAVFADVCVYLDDYFAKKSTNIVEDSAESAKEIPEDTENETTEQNELAEPDEVEIGESGGLDAEVLEEITQLENEELTAEATEPIPDDKVEEVAADDTVREQIAEDEIKSEQTNITGENGAPENIEENKAENNAENNQENIVSPPKSPAKSPEPAKEEEQSMCNLKDAKVIFVLGGPGSGKGTQCDKIVAKYGFNHLSSGDLLRAEVESGSERGNQLKESMEKGELVSMETVLELLKNGMKKKFSQNKGFLIDGYPRELEQGTRFEEEIVNCQTVLCFDVTEEVMKERLKKRGETSGRVDDNEETILRRLKTFNDSTKPVIEHYTTANKCNMIDASGSIDEIFEKVCGVIDGLNMS